MKLVFALFVIIFALSNAALLPSNKKLGRIVSTEPSLLKIEYRGSCAQFNGFASQITVNSLAAATTTNDVGCLPILENGVDANDLTAHYVCSDIGRRRSIIDVTEVFNASDATASYYTDTAYILGVNNQNAPLRVVSATPYRRPNCRSVQDFCTLPNLGTPIFDVISCAPQTVVTQRGWIMNKDLYYLVPSAFAQPISCLDTNLACCSYISHTTLGGICSLTDTTNNELFHFEERENHASGYSGQNSEEDDKKRSN